MQVNAGAGAGAVPAPQADPVAVMTRLVSDTKFTDSFGKFMSTVINHIFSDWTHGMFDLLHSAWGIPGALFHRSALDADPRIVEMNTSLMGLLAGMIGAAVVIAAVSNVIQIRKGQTPSFGGAFMNISAVVIAATFAVGSIDWLSFPLDFADILFDTIGSASLSDYASPGLVIVDTPFPAGGIILALLFFGVMAWLTFVFYKELAWCGVLLAQSVIWVFAWALPWSVPKSIGGGLGMKFIGTCFSPAVALVALRLAAPKMADFASGGGDPVQLQMLRILYAMVAYEAPGVIVGALAVHMPSLGAAYMAGRAVGFMRAGPRPGSGGGGGAQNTGAAAAASAPRAQGWNGNGPASGHTTAPRGSSARPVGVANLTPNDLVYA